MLSILAMDWHDLSRLAKKFRGSRQGGQKRPVLSDFRGADENFRGGGGMLLGEIFDKSSRKAHGRKSPYFPKFPKITRERPRRSRTGNFLFLKPSARDKIKFSHTVKVFSIAGEWAACEAGSCSCMGARGLGTRTFPIQKTPHPIGYGVFVWSDRIISALQPSLRRSRRRRTSGCGRSSRGVRVRRLPSFRRVLRPYQGRASQGWRSGLRP